MKHFLLFFLIITISIIINSIYSLNICQKSPKWRLNGYQFPRNSTAHIKIVALLRSSCGFCKSQAKRLGELKNNLDKEVGFNNNIVHKCISNFKPKKQGFNNITYLIVNSHEDDSIGKSEILQRATNLPVLQDIEKINVWKMYNGTTDDMLIFDK